MILLAITPGHGFEAQAWRRVLSSGVDAFLIREKQLPARALLDAARWCQDVAPGLDLWVAGRLDVAFAAGCGLHAPETHPDLEPGLVPLSRPLHGETQWPSRRIADQLLISPVFPSPGKGEPWGAGRLHRFLDGLPQAGPRLLALGGVDPLNAATLRHPRLAGIAAIRPYWGAEPDRAVAAFREAASAPPLQD
jgi:thiamine monophosphate synthase